MSAQSERRTGWIFAEHYLWHDTQRYNLIIAPGLAVQPGEHAENEETKRRFNNLMEVSSLSDNLVRIKPRLATREEMLRFHTPAHLDMLDTICKSGGGLVGAKTPVGAASFEIAKLAVGGVLNAVDAVMTGKIDNAYVLCRPPGHHADADAAYGFCLLANGVLGVKHAQQIHGVKRVAVVDWDVHHGNSAETAFYDDPDVLTISIHQDNLFPPGRGKKEEIGSGPGYGSNINIPMPAGSGSAAYRAAFDRIIQPALDRFAPEIIFIASGFDASAMDPLGHMMLASSDYAYMIRCIQHVADQYCDGRIVATHEGGYSAAYVPYCGLAVLEALSGHITEIEDPFLNQISSYGGQQLAQHQEDAINAVGILHGFGAEGSSDDN